MADEKLVEDLNAYPTVEDGPVKGRHWMAIMGKEGDTKQIWDPEKPDEVDAARVLFDSLKAKGYSAFSVHGKDGEKGKEMKFFDPAAGRVILTPPIRGGSGN
jgi:hypothetical protein